VIVKFVKSTATGSVLTGGLSPLAAPTAITAGAGFRFEPRLTH
jgi:hypothetical protein